MNNIIAKTKNYVIWLLSEKLSHKLHFHSLHRTFDVVSSVKEIAEYCELNNVETEILIVAAWFQDTGYIKKYLDHEEESKKIAAEFLKKMDCNDEFIQAVRTCIGATKKSSVPVNMFEMILRDADMCFLSSCNFRKYLTLLRYEEGEYLGQSYSDQEWRLKKIQLLENHIYYTGYGVKALNKLKINNLKSINLSQD
ncbi:Predicted metal-dependent phosphohydrolase, HD superfamily [Paenimyroides ummariense]|uniref:Predicted metal-dependent phosphohydrolase, HD superfamily n=1 Tax=Paenimyroides ummariense TaxID=913024 RepID=A0A1I5EYF6_9FLAO|nr:hypothetical protein [Paenimyroides ummariense]SFO16429.1 Predicted metal-dependent phosphohydrolase, HD superfamily [Paenimyroides ummariense]